MFSSPRTSAGVRKVSPAGRMASCASCAFLTFPSHFRAPGDRYSCPNSDVTCERAALMAVSDSAVESVRMYVMKPRSYRSWATRITCCDDSRSLRPPSCWRVDVMNGARGPLR